MASLNSEEAELSRYGTHLDGAYRAGIKEGMSKGLGNGMLYFSFYLSYALAFWFGTKQVGIVQAKIYPSLVVVLTSIVRGASLVSKAHDLT